jgi:carboxypeptidase Taq
MEQARRDVPGLEDEFRAGRFQGLKGWLNEKIHRAGQRYRAGKLCERVTGRPLGHQPLMAYLHGKYGPLYRI